MRISRPVNHRRRPIFPFPLCVWLLPLLSAPAGRTIAQEAEKTADPDAAFEAQKAKYEAEKGKEPFERVETILGFGDIKSEETVPFLIEIVGAEENPGIIGYIVRVLGKHGTREAVEAIVLKGVPGLMKDVTFQNTFNAIGAAAMRESLSNPLEPEAEEWLLKNGLTPEIRKNEEAYSIMVLVLAGLQSLDPMKVLDKELYRARTTESLVALLNAFRDHKPKGAAKAASRFMSSRKVEVQIAALETLLSVESKEYKSRYLQLLKSPHWQVQLLAVDLLSLFADAKLIRRFVPLLNRGDDRVRISVIAALVKTDSRDAVEPLIQALDNAEGRVKDDIADALARLTGEDLGPISAQWESWWAVNKDKAEVRRRTAEEFSRVKEAATADQKTLLYHGLRVLSDKCAFIIDCSQSMEEVYKQYSISAEEGERGRTVVKDPKARGDENVASKMEVAKKELLKVLRGMRDGVSVNILRFNTFAFPWRPALEKLTRTSRQDANDFVRASTPEGLTNISEALEITFQDERVDTIYLLSDGAPTSGKYIKTKDILDEVARLNRLRKVKINTIGFNLKQSERQLLQELADRNFGVFISR